MDAFLDTLWDYIAAGFTLLGDSFFALLQHLHFLGPLLLITLLAAVTIGLTKLLNRLIVTRRFLELEKEYHHWLKVRQEALRCSDSEKGRRMARNIDKAELNRAYYDYFFEGLLLGIARKVLPIFFIFAFLNEYYRPEQMAALFGHEYVVQLVSPGGTPVPIGAVFWYFLSLLSGYLLWSVIATVRKRKNAPDKASATPGMAEEMHA